MEVRGSGSGGGAVGAAGAAGAGAVAHASAGAVFGRRLRRCPGGRMFNLLFNACLFFLVAGYRRSLAKGWGCG